MTAASFWTHDSVRVAMGAVWATRPELLPQMRSGAAIDTRELQPGEVFFALRGDHTDGHRFLAQAADAGAAMAVIDDPDALDSAPDSLPVVRVGDTRAALGKLASSYRSTLGPVRVIAVTGSNGKTTTTRMIDACLSTTLRGHASRKSFNNDLGVPLTILGVRSGDQCLLCEVGANAPGEIEQLSRIIRPHVVVITNVGRAHLEGFGSIEGVASEKASLAEHLEPGGVVMLSADSEPLRPWRDRFERVLTFGTSPEADLRIGEVHQTIDGITFTLNEREQFSLPMLGPHNALNAAAAIAVARRVGVDSEHAREGLAAFEPPPMRLALQRSGGLTIINDAYNANPDSMLAGLRTLKQVTPAGARRVAVLGDMLELGEHAEQAHREIADAIVREDLADLVIGVGPAASAMVAPLRATGLSVESLPTLDKASISTILETLRPGDVVLLKGSRRTGLERVAEAWRIASEPSAAGGPV